MKKFVLSAVFVLFMVAEGAAQCAMCRTGLENNFSNGNPGIAAGFNSGILYLLVLPYLAVVTIAYLWYKSTRNAEKNFTRRSA